MLSVCNYHTTGGGREFAEFDAPETGAFHALGELRRGACLAARRRCQQGEIEAYRSRR